MQRAIIWWSVINKSSVTCGCCVCQGIFVIFKVFSYRSLVYFCHTFLFPWSIYFWLLVKVRRIKFCLFPWKEVMGQGIQQKTLLCKQLSAMYGFVFRCIVESTQSPINWFENLKSLLTSTDYELLAGIGHWDWFKMKTSFWWTIKAYS